MPTSPETKIGVISDIHGDIGGLERALTLLRAQNVDHIICAGDLIERGGSDEAVIERMRAENIPTVRGNHDHRVRQIQAHMRQNPDYRERILNANMGITSLPDEAVIYLSELPQTLQFAWRGVRVFMAHGTPTHLDTYIFPNAMPAALRAVLDNAPNADVVILGHTHVPMILQVGQQQIINPGSVYNCYESVGVEKSCGVLALPSRTFTLFDVNTGQPVPLEIIPRKLPT